MRLFSRTFLSPKGLPSFFFDILQQIGFKKPKGSPFYIFGHYEALWDYFEILFLVGASVVKRARLLQWLVFFLFFSSDHRPHRVCTTFYRFYCVYSSVVFTRVWALASARNLEQFFRHCATLSFFFRHCATLSFFFRHCATFLRFFFRLQRVPPSSFFDIFQQTKVPKSPKGLPFYVYRHYETVQNSFFVFFFVFCFQRVPLQFIWYLATNWIFEKPEGSRYYRFKNCAFWPSDIGPTLDVPVL